MNFNCIPGGIQAVCCDFAALESSQFHPFSSLIYTFYTFSSTFRTNLPIWMGRSRGDTHHLVSWESLVKRKRLRDRCCKLPTTQPLQTTHGAPLTVEHRCPQVQSWRDGCCDGKTLEVSVDVSYIMLHPITTITYVHGRGVNYPGLPEADCKNYVWFFKPCARANIGTEAVFTLRSRALSLVANQTVTQVGLKQGSSFQNTSPTTHPPNTSEITLPLQTDCLEG